MNWLDVVLGIFLLLTAIMGLMRGLLSTLIPLLGLIVGVVVAGNYYSGLAHGLFRSHSEAAYIAAFVVIVLLFLIAAWIVTRVLHGLLILCYVSTVRQKLLFGGGAQLALLQGIEGNAA
jgi:membrane protein required for colicin V production